MKRVMVIGGPGNISSSMLNDLVTRDFQIGLFSKPESHFDEVDHRIKIYPGERDNFPSLEYAVNDFLPDVIVDMVCFLPEQAKQIANLAQGQVKQFVFVSTVDVYGFPLFCLPMKESDPWQEHANSVYAENKRLCEDIFKTASKGGQLPLTIVRPGYSFSNRFIISALNRSAASDLLFRIKAQKPLLIPNDGRTLIHVSSGYNTGRMIAALIGDDRIIGTEYTLAHPEPMEYANYLRMFADVIGEEPQFVSVPSSLILSQPHPALKGNLLDELCQYNLFFSPARFLADFPDFEFEHLSIAAARAVKWQFDHGMVKYNPSIEDRIIEKYQKCLNSFIL